MTGDALDIKMKDSIQGDKMEVPADESLISQKLKGNDDGPTMEQDKLSALKGLELVGESLNWKFVAAGLIPLFYMAPYLTFCIVLSILTFCFGVVFESALLGKGGTTALVIKHYNRRIRRKLPEIIVPTPTMAEIPITVTPELKQSLNEFIGYIVRDFVNRFLLN